MICPSLPKYVLSGVQIVRLLPLLFLEYEHDAWYIKAAVGQILHAKQNIDVTPSTSHLMTSHINDDQCQRPTRQWQ